MPASPEDGAHYAARVSERVAELELWLLRQMAEHLRAGDDATWEQAALLGLQRWRAAAARRVAGAEQDLVDVIGQVLSAARADGAARAVADLDAEGIDPQRAANVVPPTREVEALAGRVMTAMQQVPRLLASVYGQAVAAGAREVLGGKVTRLAAAQHVLDRLVGQGITGFRDSAGRNWSLASYVEMAVRTASGQAAVDAHVAQLQAAGMDLVEVSDSPRECPACRPWEGKVLSLGGAVGAMILPSAVGGSGVRVDVAGTLEEARAAGFQHPNCTHRLRLYIPGATRSPAPTQEPDGYEAKQRQRAMERRIREWKRREALALTPEAAATARGKVRQWQAALREHVDAHDLKRLRRREQIGFAR